MSYEKWLIYIADLDPHAGREQAWLRPVLIVSGNTFNENGALVIVMPLTTKIKNFYWWKVLSPNAKNWLTEISEVLTFQIRTISTNRLKQKIGNISHEDMWTLIEWLQNILSL